MKKLLSQNRIIALGALLVTLIFSISGFADTVGDVNSDSKVDLVEAIYALQVAAGLKPVAVSGAAAPVEKTGLVTSYATGDDGALQKGAAWPDPRFTDNANGTVTDNLTGLVWLKKPYLLGEMTWSNAVSACNSVASGSYDLTDGSSAGDWRLPNIKELASLMSYRLSQTFPGPPPVELTTVNALPLNHPFVFENSLGSKTEPYWSSTTRFLYNPAPGTEQAFILRIDVGGIDLGIKSSGSYWVWPVRNALP